MKKSDIRWYENKSEKEREEKIDKKKAQISHDY